MPRYSMHEKCCGHPAPRRSLAHLCVRTYVRDCNYQAPSHQLMIHEEKRVLSDAWFFCHIDRVQCLHAPARACCIAPWCKRCLQAQPFCFARAGPLRCTYARRVFVTPARERVDDGFGASWIERGTLSSMLYVTRIGESDTVSALRVDSTARAAASFSWPARIAREDAAHQWCMPLPVVATWLTANMDGRSHDHPLQGLP